MRADVEMGMIAHLRGDTISRPSKALAALARSATSSNVVRWSLGSVAANGIALARFRSLEGAMAKTLHGKRVAILVENGFEQSELAEPRKALDQAGAETIVVSPVKDLVKGWKGGNWGEDVKVDLPLEGARAEDFDALLLPGGVINPDKLRMNEKAVALVKAFYDTKKPIAAICHGPWTLIEAGVVRGKRMTAWPSVRTDLRNAGALVEDAEVVTDQGIVTSRKPADIPAFSQKMIEEFAEGKHDKRKAA
ncbi:ThiJ/PfpI family protein [Minicystis rosea]|nr:ThiJ/PfpI family protein [Minicystis rosea]